MFTGFDMRTLLTVLTVGYVISLILLVIDFRYNQRQKGDMYFIYGRICQLLGVILVSQRGEISYILSLLVANALIMTGQALEAMAWTSLKTKITKQWHLFYGVSLGVILACLWNIPFTLSMTIRWALPLLLQSVFLLLPGLYLMFPRERSSPMQTVIGILYILGSLASLWRFQYIMGISNYKLFMTSIPHSVFFVILILLLFAGSQGYILIKKEYINKKLEESNQNLCQEKETIVYYEAELRKHQAERAELMVLQAQIKPHFLQNMLGAIGHFCRVDAAKAQQLLCELAHYLRSTFEMTADCVPLAEELKIVRAYVDIESARFGPRLDVRYELVGDLSACMIPPFTLQPLVENAVRHGIGARRQGGVIRIGIRAVDSGTDFLVEDDGVGISIDLMSYLSNSSTKTRLDGQGFGLFSVDRRLQRMFGEGIKIKGNPEQGTRVSFFIPKMLNCRPGEEDKND